MSPRRQIRRGIQEQNDAESRVFHTTWVNATPLPRRGCLCLPTELAAPLRHGQADLPTHQAAQPSRSGDTRVDSRLGQ
jgi:hypothetical protein